MCICFIQEFKVQNQSHRAHYSQGFCQRKNCNTVIFPAAPPSVPAVRGPPQGRSKKVVTGKTHNEHCPALSFSSCQRNLIKTFQIEGMIKYTDYKNDPDFFFRLVKWPKIVVKKSQNFQKF